MDKPIIESPTDVDFYKHPMGQMIFHRHPDELVIFSFMNRTKSVQLGKVLDLGRLREELEHCRTLRFSPQGLHYIMGTYEYEQPMFKMDYIEFLENFRLPEFSLSEKDGQLDLQFFGPWAQTTHWETLAMSVVNELYFETLMKGYSRFELERIEAEGRIRLARKIEELRKHPHITFSDFGTRRRFSRKWQDYVVGVLVEEFPRQSRNHVGQFRGTSNILLAQKYGIVPTGTNAHELPMAYSGIYWDEDTNIDPAFSQREVLSDWENEYGLGLSIFLPDTFGSDWFFKNAVSSDQLRNWKGSRQDSGNPLEYAYKRIAEYEALGINPMKKMIIFADGLTLKVMKEISEALDGKINYTFGWGTDLTNDLGFNPLSIVVKIVEAGDHPVAKLSDNIEKATGPSEAVERMKKAVGYTNTFSQECHS